MPESFDIERAEAALLQAEQVDCPVEHRFSDGVYLREVFMPAGTFVIGHKHKTRHFNIVLSGRARVLVDDRVVEIEGPYTFVSEPGVRKALYVLEDMRWQTVHVTEETDLDQLRADLIEESPAFIEEIHRKELLG